MFSDPGSTMSKPTVSLVLGSGGARGLAHIGVLEVLVERGFAVRSIAGTSMGALVGGVYAAGGLQVYTDWVLALERMDVLRLLDLSFARNSLFRGERVIGALRQLIGDPDIESLPLSFTAVATDLERGREVWLRRGPMFAAIHASIAMPMIFAPVHLGDRLLVDGGLVNPVPVSPTLSDLTDLTVAVNVNGKSLPQPPAAPLPQAAESAAPRRDLIRRFIDDLQSRRGRPEEVRSGLFDIVSRSMDTMESAIARYRLAAYSPDVLIEVPRNLCAFHEFHRARELIAAGRHHAALALDTWENGRLRPRS